jgi:hypothetical protein
VDCFSFTGDFCLVPAAFPVVKGRCRGDFFLKVGDSFLPFLSAAWDNLLLSIQDQNIGETIY